MVVAAKLYLPIHIFPLIFYKRGEIRKRFSDFSTFLIKRPLSTLRRAVYNFMKSASFVGLMAGIMIYIICKSKNIRRKTDWKFILITGFVSSLSLLLESHGRFWINIHRRRHEIFLFGLPRGLDILGSVIKRKNGISIPYIDALIFALVMAILHFYYQNEVQIY